MKIKTKSVFDFARIIKKANLKEDVKAIYQDGGDVQQVGIDFIFTVINACADHNVEKDLYAFLGDVVGKTGDEIELQDLETTVLEIKELSEDNPNFFKALQNLLK